MTSFRVAIQRYIRLSHPIMRQQYKTDDDIYRFTGDKLSLKLPDGSTGEAEVFVAILRCSQLTYVGAVESPEERGFDIGL